MLPCTVCQKPKEVNTVASDKLVVKCSPQNHKSKLQTENVLRQVSQTFLRIYRIGPHVFPNCPHIFRLKGFPSTKILGRTVTVVFVKQHVSNWVILGQEVKITR